MKVLITGGSGLIGRAISKKLLEKDIEVVHLTREKNSALGIKTYEWNWEKNQIDENCFKGISHIIHLAGAGIAEKPWTMSRKRIIVKSRVMTARLIRKKIEELNLPIEAFISASGIGYYGAITNDNIYAENDNPHHDFISKCCVQWEQSADLFNDCARVVKFRLGIVLDKNQGALQKIHSTLRKRIGAPIGTGRQFMPWIHVDDAAELFIFSLTKNTISGVYNAVASEHINNHEFTNKLAKQINKKVLFPNIPSIVVKGIYGELADVLIYGSRVSNKKLKKAGFSFRYDSIENAFQNIYG